MRDTIYREEAITKIAEHLGIPAENWMKIAEEWLRDVPSAEPDYTELKREFILMASYIDALLECSDEQKETLIGFISRIAEHMPWTERD